MIAGDLKGSFSNLDTRLLATNLKERLKANRTLMGLIWKFLRAGYIEEYEPNTKGGIPEGILFPLLTNFYLTTFDEFLDSLQCKTEKLPITTINPEYSQIERTISNNINKLARAHRIYAEAEPVGEADADAEPVGEVEVEPVGEGEAKGEAKPVGEAETKGEEIRLIKETIVKNRTMLRSIPSAKRSGTKIHYVRYNEE